MFPVENKFKWFFEMKVNELFIHDNGKNTLRYYNERYFYVGGKE
ncbi:hypothetical protein JCM31447_311200 [Fluviispira sanaruensis]|uniref:Uncharacterized protein n=1 Tax=Fluviispira sanaruensis TaxID=2493639 RepID=A0A4V0P235_FLUSA|nr:hypothetical protein JCM31447_311200 [Fluviispira sanaruensis]